MCGKRNAVIVDKEENHYKIQKIYEYEGKASTSIFNFIDEIKENNGIEASNIINGIKRKGKSNAIEIDNNKNILKEKEALCYGCFYKRIYGENDRKENIISTAGIALSDWINKNEEVYMGYEKFLEDSHENIEGDKFENLYNTKYKSINCNLLPKYYCIYRMDIDNLGKWMNGKYKKNHEKLFEYQKELSSSIDNFFSLLREKIRDKKSIKLIYAGGDDLLALMPVNSIEIFEEVVKECFKSEITSKKDFSKLTYSKGIFISHYRVPLREIIRVSKGELEKVKEKFKEKRDSFDTEKDATVISIMTSGYDNRNLYFKNRIKRYDAFEFIFKDLIGYFSNESTYFHNELQLEFLGFDKNGELSFDELNSLMSMFEIEQRRIMKRKKTDKNSNLEIISDKLMQFLMYRYLEIDFENYFNLFHIVRKISQIMAGEEN